MIKNWRFHGALKIFVCDTMVFISKTLDKKCHELYYAFAKKYNLIQILPLLQQLLQYSMLYQICTILSSGCRTTVTDPACKYSYVCTVKLLKYFENIQNYWRLASAVLRHSQRHIYLNKLQLLYYFFTGSFAVFVAMEGRNVFSWICTGVLDVATNRSQKLLILLHVKEKVHWATGY
jgi:hypothetical protein